MNTFTVTLSAVLILLSTIVLPAQSPDENILFKSARLMENTPITNLLQTDFDNRHAAIPDIVVSWYNSDHGYFGIYSIHEKKFMVLYDRYIDYIETLHKKPWSTNTPSSIKNSFNKSEYKNQQVVGCWEALDTDKNAYFLEMDNDQGNFCGIWSDNRGNFSNTMRAY